MSYNKSDLASRDATKISSWAKMLRIPIGFAEIQQHERSRSAGNHR